MQRTEGSNDGDGHSPEASTNQAKTGLSVYPRTSGDDLKTLATVLVEVVRRAQPRPITDLEMDEIRTTVGSHLTAAERLRQFALTNDCEPIFVVHADACLRS
jgi:hypothetical protein